MVNLTCIVCPIGCALEADDNSALDDMPVTGNKCARGVNYAREEIRAPKRVVTATVKILGMQSGGENCSVHRAPVKTSSPCLREKIPALLEDIYKVQITLPVKLGDVVIKNWQGEGIDIIATRTIN